jgi:hypothetical protein
MPDQPDPRCAVEKLESEGLSHDDAIAEVRRRQAAMIDKHGWVCHIVPDDPNSPTGFNAHTHNLREFFGHPDFQLILPLPLATAHQVLINLVDEVKAGRVFSAGTTASGIIRDFDVGFADATEGGREVLRVVIPDPEGRTARGEIGEAYRVQYEGTR